MRLDISKLDDRIRKLQEIKKIVSDPEMLAILMEFVTAETEMPQAQPQAARSSEPPEQAAPAPTGEEADRIIKEMIQSSGNEVPAGSSTFWSRGRTKT